MNMKRTLLYILTILIIVISSTSVYADSRETTYVRTTFNKSNGLPTDEANTVLQTKDGYLWVGSYGGLLRYDGSSFFNFSATGRIPTSSIRNLFEDSTGTLWIGSADAGVFAYKDNKFKHIDCTQTYGFMSIRDFAEGPDGIIYTASSSGVGIIKNGRIQPVNDARIKGRTVTSLAIDKYSRLWVATNTGKCFVLKDKKIIAEIDSSHFFEDNSKINCVSSDSEGTVYLGSANSPVAKVKFRDPRIKVSSFTIDVFDTGHAKNHNRINITQDKQILVSGQLGFALLSSEGEMINPYVEKQATAVNCATMDSEGDLWLASSQEGLVRYNLGYFHSPNNKAGLSGISINAITYADGVYYVATDGGLLAFDDSWNPVSIDITRQLNGIRVFHVMKDSSDRIWCGTYSDKGLVRYDTKNGQIVSFGIYDGMKSRCVRVSYEMKDGTIAAGTQDGLALIRDDKIVKFYDGDDGFETLSILCLLQAPDGTLLAGSAGSGIYAIKQNGKIEHYNNEQGLKDGVIFRIVSDKKKACGFVSAGSNLYYWQNDTIRKIDNLEMGAGSIHDMFEKDGNLWIIQESCLYCVEKERLLSGKQIYAIRYGIDLGLTGPIKVNTWHYFDKDGTLYLSTHNGISTFDFANKPMKKPHPIINSVEIDGKLIDHPKSVRLKKDSLRLTIDFAALSLSGSSDMHISYQVIGFTKKKILVKNYDRNSVSYTNIPGGTYTFRLCVFDAEHPNNQEVLELPIVKDKKLTEYTAFYLLMGGIITVVALSVTYIVNRNRVKKMIEEQEHSRRLIEQSLQTFARTIDAKDSYTNGHSIRVAKYSREIARRMGYKDNDLETIYYVALLHDIGKIGIPDSILNKNGALTPEEMAIIRTHPDKGGDILKKFTALKGIADGARYHHERFDGKGYSEGLEGEQIPLMARIICVADCYDAMSNDRCYRKALPAEKIYEEIDAGAGSQFDPQIAEIMKTMILEQVVPIQDIE